MLMTLSINDILRKKLESIEETTSIQEVAKKMKDTNVRFQEGEVKNLFMLL
jgi:predicted transcriptional regulator